MVATLVALLAFAGNAGAVTLTGGTGTDPWISSDLPDYAPGSTVNLLGGSWQPGEAVHIVVNDNLGQTWAWSDDVTADSGGGISDSLTLPEWFVASYSVTATGASGSAATSSFTDGNVNVRAMAGATAIGVTFPIGSAKQFPNSACSGAASASNVGSFTTPTNGQTTNSGISADSSANPPQSASVQAPSTATIGGTTYTFSGWTADGPTQPPALGVSTIAPQTGCFSRGSTPTGNNPAWNMTANYKVSTSTALSRTSGTNPSTFGDSLTFRATVTQLGSATAVTSGAVKFFDGGASCAAPGSQIGADQTLNASGQASITTSTLSVGSHTILACYQGATGFDVSSNAINQTVNPACTAVSVSTNPTDQTITYGADASFTASAAGSPAPTVRWQVDSGSGFADLSGQTTSTLTLTKPTVSMSGNQYRAVFTNTCSGTQTATTTAATLTVNRKSITITPDGGQGKVYGDADPTLTYASAPALESGDGFTGALGRAAGENAGSYGITLGTLSAGDNYSLSLTAPAVRFAITKAPLTVTADNKTRAYGDADPSFTASYSGFKRGENLATSGVSGNPSLTTTATASSNVGSYAITAGLGTLSSSNYSFTFANGTLTIGAATLSVNAGDKAKTYGDDDPAAGYTLSGFKNGEDAISAGVGGTAGCSIGSHSENVGAYDDVYSCGPGSLAAGNYDFVAGSNGKLTITKKAASVTAEDKTKVYGSDDPALTTTNSGFLAADLGAGKITFGATRAAGETVAGGPYSITPSASDAGSNLLDNYDVTYHNGALTITKKAASVTAEDKTKVYGDADPALTTTHDGFLAADLGPAKITFGASRTAGETVAGGPYPITPSASDGASNLLANYDVTYHNGALTITKKAASVTAEDKTKVYGDADPALTTSSSGFLAADLGAGKITFGATRAAGETVAGGPYPVTPSASDGASNLLANYGVTYNPGQLTIGKRPLTVTADNKSKTYDGNPFSGGFTRTISGFAFGETDSVVSGSVGFNGPAATAIDAGNYVITVDVSGLSAANYSFSAANVNSGNLTINQRPITVAADPKTKVFGTSDPALTYQLTAGTLVGGDSLSGNLTRDPGELVGTYAIKRGSVTAGANYAITYVGANLAITAWNAAGKGFYAPVGADSAHSIFTAAPGTAPTTKPGSMVWNTVKGGQTVPLKFNVFAGAVEKTASDAFPGFDVTKAFQMQKLANCTDSVATDPVDYTATSGQTTLRYDTTGMQWIQNWATPKVSATTCYRTFVTFADGSTLEAFFQLTK